MRIHSNLLTGLLVAAACDAAWADAPPSFAVREAGGKLTMHDAPQRGVQGEYVVDDARFSAAIRPVRAGVWELSLRAKQVTLDQVWFPWPAQHQRSDSQIDEDTLYYPVVFGTAQPARQLKEFAWAGAPYPGGCLSPLAIFADAREAFIVAAENWPPRRVKVLHSRGRISLVYEQRIGAGESATFCALIQRVTGDTHAGRPPWLLAIAEYRTWLRERCIVAGIQPAEYPQWLRDVHGWIHVGLESVTRFDAGVIREQWRRWGGSLGWVQFWGQMSNYSGPRQYAVPALAAGEEASCCLDRPAMHPRYLPELPKLAREIARSGHAGFYSRPGETARRFVPAADGSVPADLQHLLDWQRRNREEYGANAYYMDVLGGLEVDDPLGVARVLKQSLPADAVVEKAIDLYPAASLQSGGLSVQHAFPRLGRALLDDRIIFLGESNGDHTRWGRAADYQAERQAFLLGAKFDAIRVDEDQRGTPDRALARSIELRKQVDWWQREPTYRDVLGLTHVPEGVEVRRFVGRGGETLLAIDNWQQQAAQSLAVDGRTVAIPIDRLSIIVLPAQAAEHEGVDARR